MCLTDDEDIAEQLRVLRNHGRLANEFIVPAGNFRMTEIAAALGLTQLQRLDEIVGRRREIGSLYREGLGDTVDLQATPDGARSNYQTFGVVLPQGQNRDAFREELRTRGVEAGLLSYAVHELGSFAGHHESLPIAEHIAAHGVALPLYPQMRNTEVQEVIRRVREVLDE